MSNPRDVKSFQLAKGVTQTIQYDETQPESGPLSRYRTKIVCEGGPDSEAFDVPMHWHKYHDEYMRVLEGRIEITLDGQKRIVTADDGEQLIRAPLVHGLRSFKGERLVMLEQTTPPGDYKARFFNDLLSIGVQPDFGGAFWHTMRVFYDGDTYPALGLYFRFPDVVFITVFGGIAKLFAPKKPDKLE